MYHVMLHLVTCASWITKESKVTWRNLTNKLQQLMEKLCSLLRLLKGPPIRRSTRPENESQHPLLWPMLTLIAALVATVYRPSKPCYSTWTCTLKSSRLNVTSVTTHFTRRIIFRVIVVLLMTAALFIPPLPFNAKLVAVVYEPRKIWCGTWISTMA